MIRRVDEGTVKRNDSKINPPKPNPRPIINDPINSFAVILDFLSCNLFENKGFLLNRNKITIHI